MNIGSNVLLLSIVCIVRASSNTNFGQHLYQVYISLKAQIEHVNIRSHHNSHGRIQNKGVTPLHSYTRK